MFLSCLLIQDSLVFVKLALLSELYFLHYCLIQGHEDISSLHGSSLILIPGPQIHRTIPENLFMGVSLYLNIFFHIQSSAMLCMRSTDKNEVRR